jgi:hypothetical protein
LRWFEQLQDWVSDVIAPLGLELTGGFSQLNASPDFSLVSFETSGAPVWFKAAGKPNWHEWPITIALSQRVPRYLPTILASHVSWRGWLMNDGGTALAKIPATVEMWRQAAVDLAGLQVESIEHTNQLLEAGACDLCVPNLLTLVDPFLDVANRLMREQTKPSPPPLQSIELFRLGAALKEALRRLDGIALPSTIGHCDLNPTNILWTGSCCLFIDWAEACVGHPFFTLEYVLAHLRNRCPDMAPFIATVQTSYSLIWERTVSAKALEAAIIFSPIAAVFAHAVSLRSWKSRSPDEPASAYLRSLTRRMKAEADRLQRRSLPCLRN